MPQNVIVPPFVEAPQTVVGGTPQSAFPFAFPFWSTDDIVVYVDDELIPPADYTVEGLAVQSAEVVEGGYGSGTVTFDVAVSSCIVTIDRSVVGDRQSQFSRAVPLDMRALNGDLNRVTARQQDLERHKVTRPTGDRAGMYLAFDADGNETPASGTGSDPALRADLAGDGGSLLILHKRGETGTFGRSLRQWDVIGGENSVLQWIDPDLDEDILDGSSTEDVSEFLQQAHADARVALYPRGAFKLTDQLEPIEGQVIIGSPGTLIRQYTANKPIFYAAARHDITFDFNGATLHGEGTWSNDWTGNGGHDDKGIWLDGCDRARIIRPHIKNCGLAGIVLWGGTGGRIIMPRIEGTNEYSSPIPSNGNFQMGIYLHHNTPYGAVDDLIILAPDISGTAQGILSELPSTGAQPEVGIQIISPVIHDITGQHAFYFQSGEISVTNPMLRNIELAGFKIQSTADNNMPLTNVVVTGVNAKNLGSNLFEVAQINGAGSISNVQLSGVGKNVGTGIGIVGDVRNVMAHIEIDGCATALGLYGSENGNSARDIDIWISARNCTGTGIDIAAPNPTGIRLHGPLVRNPNTSDAANKYGILINCPAGEIDIWDPVVTDANVRMDYGFYSAADGPTIRVHGSATFTGATDYAVRSNGAIAQWPTETTLQGALGKYLSTNGFSFSGDLLTSKTTTTASNVDLWSKTLPDESAYQITARITGKKSDGAQRAAYESTVLVYRDGGVATIQGSADTDVSIASGSFAGAYTWAVSEGTVFLQVNSGGTDTYNWTGRINLTAV